MIIKKNIVRGLIGLIGLMGLVSSCTDEALEKEPTTVTVVSYVSKFQDHMTATRAWAIPTGYEAYEDGEKTIGICFTQDGVDPTTPNNMIGHFFKSGEHWRTNLELTSGTYYLYGYIPHTAGISCSITDLDGTNAHYSEGAILSLDNVPAVMPNDLCVVIGAKDGSDKNTDSGLERGDFSYTASGSVEGNFVFLLFDHLYASVRIRMKVHPDYDVLRTIKLKNLELETQIDGTPTRKKTNIDVELTANNEGNDPITSLTFTPAGEVIDGGMSFWSSAAGETLTTSYTSRIGNFMPQGITTLKLTSTYDVYDKKGNLIRKDCKATNTMPLKELLTGQTETRRAHRYTVNMTIKPTYLYMLSDPDLDNPTVTLD